MLQADRELGPGDFSVRARLSLLEIQGSAASFVVDGENHFGFGGEHDSPRMFAEGPLFERTGLAELIPLPLVAEHVREGREFEFEAAREGEVLRFTIDGKSLYSVQVGAGRLGSFGLRPQRARLRVFDFRASGALLDPLEHLAADLAALQPAIDDAIDAGVEYLLATQLRDGSWAYHAEAYRNGQTALSAYTLLKSGLDADHPAVVRALTYLRQSPPRKTYSAACQLMALAATRDPARRDEAEEVLEFLLDGQRRTWGYPGGDPDLSNTQYAALGLRAAQSMGLEIPSRTWSQLAQGTLAQLVREERVEALPGVAGRSGTGQVAVAGFGYRPESGEATGSMTTAGVAILALCQEGLGSSMTASLGRKVERGRELGLAWLVHHFAVDRNPGKSDWVYYYLYGLERVGALLGIELLGQRPWYYEGARHLVVRQRDDGSWSGNDAEADTCFALLFLSRATASVTGAAASKRPEHYVSEGEEAAVRMRASGDTPLALWITGFAPGAIEQHAVGVGLERGLAVRRVEYVAGGEVVATVDGDPGRAWTQERYPAQVRFERGGTYRINVRVHVAGPGGPAVLEGVEFEVRVDEVTEPWMLEYARAGAENLLEPGRVEASASSSRGGGEAPAKAADGFHGTAWVCRPDDGEPWLVLELDRAVRIERVLLSQVGGTGKQRGEFDRITRVSLRLGQSKEVHEITLEEDVRKKTVFELPRRTRVGRIELRILARERGSRHPGAAGFAEIELTGS